MSKKLAVTALVMVALAVAAPAMAETGSGTTPDDSKDWWQYGAAAFAIGIAAAFGALGQAKGLAAACEAIGRNPGAVGPIRITMIIGLALIESLVIYALIIAFLILA